MARLLDLSLLTFLTSDFFILEGPDGEPLACQWTASRRSTGTSEFEIITPANPDTMGCLFGLYDAKADEFRMRMPIDRDTGRVRNDLKVNLDWRGDRNNVLDIGSDWDWDKSSNRLVIAHSIAA